GDFVVNVEKVTSGSGDDVLSGGLMDGGPGADTMTDGRVTYEDRTNPLTVTLDGIANDGEAGEGDDVERAAVFGGGGNDTLTAGASGSGLAGGPGNDVITGGPGIDYLSGGDGDDTIDSKD